MWSYIYKKLVIDFSKFTLFLLTSVIVFSLYQAKNFNLDASSDALLLDALLFALLFDACTAI